MELGATLVTHTPTAAGKPGFFRNLLYWLLDIDDPAFLEAGVQRMRNAPGFLDSLSPEALEHIRSYDGPENLGPPLTRRERRALEQRQALR
jgi:hypothetical protein